MLQEAVNKLKNSARHESLLEPAQTATGSSQNIQIPGPTSKFDRGATLFSPENNNAVSGECTSNFQGSNIVVTDATPPMPYTDVSQAFQPSYDNGFANQGDFSGGDVVYPEFDSPMSMGTYVDSYVPALAASGSVSGTAGRPRNACNNMVDNDSCRFGDRCKYSHDPAVIEAAHASRHAGVTGRVDKQATMPCRNMKNFDVCKTSDCPYFHKPSKLVGDIGPISFATPQKGQQQGRKKRSCWNKQGDKHCTKPNCTFDHRKSHGSELGDAMSIDHSSGNQAGPSNSNLSINNSDRICHVELRKGCCTKCNCKWDHIEPYGPEQNDAMSIDQSGSPNGGHGIRNADRLCQM